MLVGEWLSENLKRFGAPAAATPILCLRLDETVAYDCRDGDGKTVETIDDGEVVWIVGGVRRLTRREAVATISADHFQTSPMLQRFHFDDLIRWFVWLREATKS